mgnify:CR=1 FL=1
MILSVSERGTPLILHTHLFILPVRLKSISLTGLSPLKIVFSGDTAFSYKLIEEAKGADILIHEVYSEEGFKKKSKDWQIYHKAHHTSSVDVGIIANKVNPKKLVLSHILFWGFDEESILKDVSLNYNGETIIAEDKMVIK